MLIFEVYFNFKLIGEEFSVKRFLKTEKQHNFLSDIGQNSHYEKTMVRKGSEKGQMGSRNIPSLP